MRVMRRYYFQTTIANDQQSPSVHFALFHAGENELNYANVSS